VSDLPTVVLVAINLSKMIHYTVLSITLQKTAVFVIVFTFPSMSAIGTFELIAEYIYVVGLKSSVNDTRKQTKQRIRTN
jgi:hypothetical protein